MNPYQVLGVSQTDDEDIIKKAYRKAAKECHPDTHPGDKRAEERFKEIGEAYRILSDKQKEKSMMPEQHRENGKVRQADTVPKQAEGAPEDRFIREISKRNLNGFFQRSAEREEGKQFTAKINPMDVTDLFERYMGFKH